MAEIILSDMATALLHKLASNFHQNAWLEWGVDNDRLKLYRSLSSIRAAIVLDDDQQQGKMNAKQTSDWLMKIKDVFYDVDDLLDEFEIAAKQKMLASGSFKRKVCYFFSDSNPLAICFYISQKIKEIRKQLDSIGSLTCLFDPRESLDLREHPRVEPRVGRDDDLWWASDVIGRNHDKEIIIKLLLHSYGNKNIYILSVVGNAGLGKTTLVKMVYGDARIVQHFDVRMSVIIHDDHFMMTRWLRAIVEAATREDCSNLDVDKLQDHLTQALNGKKYLLVLNDVYVDNEFKWKELKSLLMCGAEGSRIVMTTRPVSVPADIDGIYDLAELTHEDSLSLLDKCVFQGQKRLNSKLVEIGDQIVRKCKGNPLALKILAGILYGENDECEWISIRENAVWKSIEDNQLWKSIQNDDGFMPLLRLSYDRLRPHLKRCFAYCSIFPKGHVIHNLHLINLWIANDLILSTDVDEELEHVAKEHVKELLSRSFFHDVEDLGIGVTFKMHDVVHDLALSVAESECMTIDSPFQRIPDKVRNVMFSPDYDLSSKHTPRSLHWMRNLRSIALNVKGTKSNISTLVTTLNNKFNCLRVLDLSCLCFDTLPSSIARLKHLRYLNLSGNHCLRSLPNSISELVSLKTLILSNCVQLDRLPNDLFNLISLEFLEITTKQRILLHEGTDISPSLRFLSIINCENLKKLCDDEMTVERFSALAFKTLVIDSCRRLVSLPRGIKHLTALEKISLARCPELNACRRDLVFLA